MQEEQWNIELAAIDDLATISSWYLPWHFNLENEEVKYDAPKGHPIQLSEIPRFLPFFSEKRRKTLTDFARIMTESRHPFQLVVPCYAVNESSCLFMDGNHRMAALMMAQVPFSLLAFVVHGPIDNSIIPELRHWENTPTVRKWE